VPETASEATRVEVWQGEGGGCRNGKGDMAVCGRGRLIHQLHDGSRVDLLLITTMIRHCSNRP
jgi:hypothetical protein